MKRLPCLAAVIVSCLALPAAAQQGSAPVPSAISSYAEQFESECRSRDLGHVILNDNFDGGTVEPSDLNADGQRDFLVYKCMFGCSRKPHVFDGIGTPCPWGELLLSRPGGHDRVFVPGMISTIAAGPPIRIAVKQPRALRMVGNYCADGLPDFTPLQAYELKGGRFQQIGVCPAEGCNGLLGKSLAQGD
jgi:hypothetical protein